MSHLPSSSVPPLNPSQRRRNQGQRDCLLIQLRTAGTVSGAARIEGVLDVGAHDHCVTGLPVAIHPLDRDRAFDGHVDLEGVVGMERHLPAGPPGDQEAAVP